MQPHHLQQLEAASSGRPLALEMPNPWPSWVCHKCRKPNPRQRGTEPAMCTSTSCRHLWCMACPELADVMELESRIVLGRWTRGDGDIYGSEQWVLMARCTAGPPFCGFPTVEAGCHNARCLQCLHSGRKSVYTHPGPPQPVICLRCSPIDTGRRRCPEACVAPVIVPNLRPLVQRDNVTTSCES